MSNNRWTEDGRCVMCNDERTPEGHDPCLGTLPGVDFACCGHGVDQGYVAFSNGKCIYFDMKSVGQAHRDVEPVAKIVIEEDGTVTTMTPYYTEQVNMVYGEPQQFTEIMD